MLIWRGRVCLAQSDLAGMEFLGAVGVAAGLAGAAAGWDLRFD